ncbi:AraC family transcriptional regulator [Paenibacillus swuensis]|uniref:AraC family transcriptional regulator n=1 Tax=Paenibacillus swuensis TaxID=1178515 RepID=A0A172TJG3_9BACL|nr:AraC family transcriptional regulator [Paenibacillus swuensis]ANE46987.1 AraC family transcriptional regulator [Paenibacillus swuensis]
MRTESYYVVSNPSVAVKDQGLRVLFAGHSQTKPGHKNGPKVFDFFLVHYVKSGKGVFTCLGKHYELQAGDSFFIKPGRLVTYQADAQDPWEYRWIACAGEAAEAMFDEAGISSHTPVIRVAGNRWFPVLFNQMERTLKEKGDNVNRKTIGYWHLLLAEYQEAQSPKRDAGPDVFDEIGQTVQAAVQYLSTQYSEAVTIEMMAESLGYNRAYLSKIFKQRMQESPVTFLLHIRLDKARLLIRERMELTLEQIASSVGFGDALYFSKQFKKRFSLSPSAYRREMERMEE